MTVSVTQTFPRLWSIEAGVAMVVTDLHGDWEAYRRYRDRFVDLQAHGRADYLVFTGDLIHAEDPTGPDHSLEIVLDVLTLQESYGYAVIYLSGNHELPHIYGISLGKGKRVYTPFFETALSAGPHRSKVIARFKTLPFYLRTRAGVSLAHAGAAAFFADPDRAKQIFNWSHQTPLDWADEFIGAEDVEVLRNGYAKLNQVPYDLLANHYLAVSGPEDPRYNDLLRGFLASSHPAFERLLWPALFTRCEQEYGLADYAIFLEAMLQALSQDFFPQQILVAGHMTIAGGYRVVAKRHLRLASAHHATPREAGSYLLFDTAQPVESVEVLLAGLGSVYH